MVTDEIQKVTELEQEVKQKKENAAAQNKQRVSQAQRAARLAVEQARQQAETEAGAMICLLYTSSHAIFDDRLQLWPPAFRSLGLQKGGAASCSPSFLDGHFKEGRIADQIPFKEYTCPFMGSR